MGAAWLALLAAAAISLAPRGAHAGEAEDRAEAKRLYAEARRLRAQGDVEAALERFRRAHELAPTPVTRVELARELAQRGALREASALLRSVPDMPPSPTETIKGREARKEALQLLRAVEERMPHVTLSVVPAGDDPLQILLDDATFEPGRLGAPEPVDPGTHRVIVRRGEAVVERTFSIVEGETQQIEVRLPEPPAAPPPAPVVTAPAPTPRPAPAAPPPRTPPPSEPVAGGTSPLVPASFVVAGVGLATGLVTGGVAFAQKGDLEERCPGQACPPDAHGLLTSHEVVTTTSTVAFAVAGVATAAGVVLWVLDEPAEPDRQSVSLDVRWFGTGLAVEGTWF